MCCTATSVTVNVATAGARITEQAQGEPVTICMEVSFHTVLDDPVFAFNVIYALRAGRPAEALEHFAAASRLEKSPAAQVQRVELGRRPLRHRDQTADRWLGHIGDVERDVDDDSRLDLCHARDRSDPRGHPVRSALAP